MARFVKLKYQLNILQYFVLALLLAFPCLQTYGQTIDSLFIKSPNVMDVDSIKGYTRQLNLPSSKITIDSLSDLSHKKVPGLLLNDSLSSVGSFTGLTIFHSDTLKTPF